VGSVGVQRDVNTSATGTGCSEQTQVADKYVMQFAMCMRVIVMRVVSKGACCLLLAVPESDG
jgi:hypothetical protein